MDKVIVDIVRDASEELVFAMKQNILEKGKFVPNAPYTIRKKGFDHPLHEHGELVNSITYEMSVNENSVTGRIGVFDPELERIALINEYGDERIPSRPFLRLTFDENVDRISDQVINRILDYAEEVMRE